MGWSAGDASASYSSRLPSVGLPSLAAPGTLNPRGKPRRGREALGWSWQGFSGLLGGPVAKVGDVPGDPEGVAVSTVEGQPLVSVWLGLEATDLSPDAADQLAAFLRIAAARARQQRPGD